MSEPTNILEQILLEGEAMELSDSLIKFLGDRIEERDPYVVMTAMENLLVHLVDFFDEEEQFPVLASLLHNISIKLYEKNTGEG